MERILIVLVAFGLSAAPAQAGPNRTFVSGTGTDSGTCTRTAPCRTFAFAITVTNAGGEIDVLDPAGYGPVTITLAISIVNDGGVAGTTAGSGLNGVTINAGPSDSVHLRGLTIDGLGSGQNGILFNSGGNLEIENCVIQGFTNAGVTIVPSTSSGFSVSNTIASNNGNNSEGIFVAPTGAAIVNGVLSKVTTNNNGGGIQVEGPTGASLNVVIVDSEASNNAGAFGVAAGGTGGAAIAILVRNVVASNEFMGLEAGLNATLRVANSAVTGNTTGVFGGGGTIFTYGNNDINGNATDVSGTLTPVATR